MKEQERFYFLLQRFHDKTASQEELQELLQWINNSGNEEELMKLWAQSQGQGSFFSDETSGQLLNGILHRQLSIKRATKKKRIIRMMTAAAVFLFCVGGYFLLFNNRSHPDKIVQTQELPANDVTAPHTNNAVITFSDGSKVVLENAQNGSLAMQGNIKVVKLAEGQIMYTGSAMDNSEVKYNVLTVPRGSKIVTLTLADGSKIWMNAESSLRYPTAFTGKQRRVEITGEAFFEVAKDPGKPFIVSKQDMSIEVVGTQFNVNAYDDEGAPKVTLLEGSVKVLRGKSATILIPGQQALVNETGEIGLVKNADLEAAVAWKNGYFQFAGSNIQTVMRQIARWYDVDVNYEGTIPERQFAGQMERANNLSKVLRILEESKVHFRIEGKKVTVMP